MGKRHMRNMEYSISDGVVTATNANTGLTFTFDEADYETVSMYSWRQCKQGYVVSQITKSMKKNSFFKRTDKTWLRLHRLIMNAPNGVQVDHANGNPLDNRRCNLRFCSTAENQQNRRTRRDSSSGYKGVYHYRHNATNPWQASIKHFEDGVSKYVFLGNHPTPEQAALAYNEAAIKYHGEFARLNIIVEQTVADEVRALVETAVECGYPRSTQLFTKLLANVDGQDTATAIEALKTSAQIMRSFEVAV